MTEKDCKNEMNQDQGRQNDAGPKHVNPGYANRERMPFYLSLGQRVQSFQVAQMSILEELPAAAQAIFTDRDEHPPDEEESTSDREQA